MNPISDGYEKLLSSYKELEEINSSMVEFVKNEFPENSTLIAWGAVTYGSYVPGRSDFDFIIVTHDGIKADEIRQKLSYECYKYTNLSPDDLDVLVIDYDALKIGTFEGNTVFGVHKLGNVDNYIISHFGKLLLGEEEILELFPTKKLIEFYPEVVKSIRVKIKNDLYNSFSEENEPSVFIEQNMTLFTLIFRVIFTYLNKEIWGKVESIDWVIDRLDESNTKELKRLGKLVRQVYLFDSKFDLNEENFSDTLNKGIKEFMKITKEKMK